jgi:hypothetical protein
MILSAVLAVDRYETAAEAIDALSRQTIADSIEIVLVGPAVSLPDDRPRCFADIRVVEAPIDPLSAARARAILACSGRYVFVAETHGFPRPDCLALLVAALEAGATAVMPRLVNANPDLVRSWASLFATYGGYTGTTPRSLTSVALHNGCFRREALAEIAAASAPDLVYGVGLSERLRADGCEMRYVPEAVLEHVNVTSVRGILLDRSLGGRLWAARRSIRWSRPRRLAHAAAFPLAPFVMTRRIVASEGWRQRGHGRPRGTLAAVVAMAALQSVGEALGYALGSGDSEVAHRPLELHRRAYAR